MTSKKTLQMVEDQQKNDKSWKSFLKVYLVLAVLFFVMFTMRSTVTILQVFVPNLSTSFKVTEGTIAILFAIYNLSAAFVSLLIGPVVERFGYKLMMYIGMFIFATATMFSTFATKFWMMAITQVVAGIGAACFGPANIAYAGDFFPKTKRTTAIGLIMSSFYIGSIVAVPINSYIADLFNWQWGVRTMSIFSFLVFLMILFIIPRIKGKKITSEFKQNQSNVDVNDNETSLIKDKHPDSEVELSYINRMKQVLSNKYALGTFFITLFQRGGLFAMITLLSTWLVAEFNLETTTIGIVFMGAGIAALVSNTFFSWLADKVGKKAIILVGTSLTAIWIGIFPLISFTASMAIINIIILNFIGAISMGSYNAFITEITPCSKGTTLSINNTFGQISQAAAVAIIGKVIFDLTGNYFYCGLAAMTLYAISVILMLFFIRPKEIEKYNALRAKNNHLQENS